MRERGRAGRTRRGWLREGPRRVECGRTVTEKGGVTAAAATAVVRQVVGRDALLSPALAQLLRRRQRECIAARYRSPRSRAATGVTRVLVILHHRRRRRQCRLAAVHLAVIFHHGDS